MFKKKIFLSIIAFVSLLTNSLSFSGGAIFDSIEKGDWKEVKRLVKEKKINVNQTNK